MILRVFQDPSPANRRCWFAGRRRQSRVGSHQQLATPVSIRGWHFNSSHVESSNPCMHTSWWSSRSPAAPPVKRLFITNEPCLSDTNAEREAPKFFDLLACCVFPAGLQLVRLWSLAAGRWCLRVTLWQRPQRVLAQQTWQPPGTVNSHLPY